MNMGLSFSMSCRAIFMAMLLVFSLFQSLLQGAWQPQEGISDPIFPGAFVGGPVMVANPQGNAIAIWPDEAVPANSFNPSISSAFYTRGVGWGPSQLISSMAINPMTDNFFFHGQGDPDIAMNSSNYAVAVWEGEYSVDPNFPQAVFARISSNGIWPEPALDNITVLSDQSGNFDAFNIRVAVNDGGMALATWRQEDISLDTPLDYTMISFLPFGGTWTTPVIISDPLGEVAIGDINQMPNPQLNQRGDAVVTWFRGLIAPNSAAIMASTYNSATATWTLATLDTGTFATLTINPRCGIDANGNAVAVWATDFGTKASFFNGSSWAAPVFIYPSSVDSIVDTYSPDVVMDPQGNSTAMWTAVAIPSVQTKLFSSFLPLNGTWSAPERIGPEDSDYFFLPFQSQEPLAVDPAGNVIAIFSDKTTGNILSSFRSFDPSWDPPEVISNGGLYLNIGLASCGFAVATWFDGNAPILAAVNENAGNLLAVENPQGKQCTDSFATQKRCCNILRWSPNPCAIAYHVWRNGKIIATVKGNKHKYTDCSGCCDKKNVYAVSAINISGAEGEQVPVDFN